MPESFTLDPRLAHDTAHVADLPLCTVRLMNDARFPWLILVPRIAGLHEIDDLEAEQQIRLLHETQRCSDALRACFPVDKINIGALGNIVRQLHVHVVARTENDEAWPGPVWGHGHARVYAQDSIGAQVRRIAAALAASPAHES